MSEEEKRYTQSMEETTADYSETLVVEPTAASTDGVKEKKKSPIVFGIIAVVLVLAAAVVFFTFRKTGTSETENTAVKAKLTENRTAYIPLFNGKNIEIQGEIQEAWLTKNRKYIVVLQKDGVLYVTDLKQSKKSILADNAESIVSVHDSGILYDDKEKTTYRVLFKDDSSVKVGEDITVITANNTLSALFATGEGDIYILTEDATEPRKVDTFDYSVRVKDISDDGQVAVWADKDGSDYQIVLNVADESQKLGKVTPSYSQDGISAVFSKDQKLAVVASNLSDHLWIQPEGKDVVDVNLGAELAYTTIYSQMDYLSRTNAADVSALYVTTEGSDYKNNIYCITLEGERDRVLSDVSDFAVAGGKAFYINKDGSLYYAKPDGANLKDEEKIASDVTLFEVAGNGNYIYYVKESGALYCYSMKEKEPVKVASEVATLYNIVTYNKYSADGSTVLYYTDLEDVKNTYKDYGNLMMWTYGEKEAHKISSEVLTSTISSGLKTGAVNKNGFTYLKYDSVNADGDVSANWMYYDGKEPVKIASDVIA